MVEFDVKKFNEFCEKYGIVMSKEYDQPMFKKEDGSIVPLEEKYLKKMIEEMIK